MNKPIATEHHLGLSRRSLLRAAAGAPLAAVLANPALAQVAASTLGEVTIMAESSGVPVRASLAVPRVTPAPAVILIHEWWGLNDQIKAVAADLAKAGYLALAIDLYGRAATDDRTVAGQLASSIDDGAARDTVRSWANWLRAHEAATGKVASIGWCFGGRWSLEAAIEAGVDGAIVYYGRVTASAERLGAIKGPVLGHFATLDKFITAEMVDAFEARMAAAGKSLETYWYEADHAFANPTSARYDDADAQLAWQRSLAFLGNVLRD